ncbi:doublecortin domain-containing protein 2C-like [Tachypleus tridentatus]|uniref:doublecortin domain-containing protein 2C-like n=1 Tax=Tachypleus tridentatus TaxID=6853 RepID=UPI003FD230A5
MASNVDNDDSKAGFEENTIADGGTAGDSPAESVITANAPDAKWIQVYVNGDEHFPGFRCLVNNKHYRNYESLLSYLTEKLQPSFGAVRNIYTPVNGTKLEELKDLKMNHKYVAAGSERLKKLEPGYAEIGGNLKKPVRKVNPKVKPASHSKVQDSVKIHNSSPDVVTIFAFNNGDGFTSPQKIVINKHELTNWSRVLQTIGEAVQPQSRVAKRLHTIDGKPVNGPEDLVSGRKYVVVGNSETFKKVNYGMSKGNVTSKKLSVLQPSPAKGLKTGTNKTTKAKPKTGSQQSTKNTNEDVLSTEEYESISKSSTADSENLFHAKGFGSTSAGPAREVDLDQDLGGVYRAKQHSPLTEGATEINETPETAVDLPVEQLEAEEVLEEDTNSDNEENIHELSFVAPHELVPYLPSMQGKHNVSKHNIYQQGSSHNVSQHMIT